MKAKVTIAGAVVLTLVLFFGILLSVHRQPAQPITVRHIRCVHSGNETTMIFEVTNHTADTYVFLLFSVQVRDGNAWSTVQGLPSITGDLASWGVASYTVNVTNLPANSGVRFSMTTHKVLLGVEGFVKRVELRLKFHTKMSLNPYDKNSHVFGKPIRVYSEEWVETAK